VPFKVYMMDRICHVNKDILDKLDVTELAVNFVRRSTITQNIFGLFH